ncbi:radical SAM protein [Deinococcus arcticus]|uniref:radical SAM protein n=1 Tax=Deinococcus arcticus TaxID=2136176 RepID=UPI001E47D891|nr:radical SAM protein [Deinococcus arcticus]
MFDPLTGHRVSFGPVPDRLRAPELLDVKLTDRCSLGCTFCYQDSRPDRAHAQLDNVAFVAHQAGQAGVFEVALGGGEVSEYPHFLETLRLFRQAGVVPNFTTRRPAWVAERWASLRDLAGGFAVSVATAHEVEEVGRLFPLHARRDG